MVTPLRARRVPVRINPAVWEQEIERYVNGAAPRVAAERERSRLERDGVQVSLVRAVLGGRRARWVNYSIPRSGALLGARRQRTVTTRIASRATTSARP